MKLTSIIATLLLSTSAFSAVDYSYCQKQFNSYLVPNKPCKEVMGMFTMCGNYTGQSKGEDNSYYPFELTADGQIKAHPTLNYKSENGKESITSNDKNSGYEANITRNEKGEITGISTSFSPKNMGGYYGGSWGPAPEAQEQIAKNLNSFERKTESNVKLEIRNGKCIPSRIDSVNSLGDESRQDVNFDAKLCRNVAQFFKKNPEAASCFDKNLMDKAQGIFNDYYQDNKDIYGEVNTKDIMSQPKPLRTKLKSDMNKGGMYGGGYGYPGIGVNGMGMGMGMGMPGASTEQMLTPMGMTMDSVLANSKAYPGFGGFGNSPVVAAMQLMTLCQGGGFGPNVLHDVVYDESVWKTESADSKSPEIKVLEK